MSSASQYFQHFDKDKSGSIDKAEFNELYESLKSNGFDLISEEDTREIMDTNSNSAEYVDWLIKIGSIPCISE